MTAKSIKGKSPEEIRTKIVRIMEDGYKPNLAFVFASVSQNRDEL